MQLNNAFSMRGAVDLRRNSNCLGCGAGVVEWCKVFCSTREIVASCGVVKSLNVSFLPSLQSLVEKLVGYSECGEHAPQQFKTAAGKVKGNIGESDNGALKHKQHSGCVGTKNDCSRICILLVHGKPSIVQSFKCLNLNFK